MIQSLTDLLLVHMVDTFVDWEDIDSVSVDIGRDIVQAHSLVDQTVLVGQTDLFKKKNNNDQKGSKVCNKVLAL